MNAQLGDRLIIEGDHARAGLVIGLPNADGSPPYVVKWLADGHITLIVPGDYTSIIRSRAPGR